MVMVVDIQAAHCVQTPIAQIQTLGATEIVTSTKSKEHVKRKVAPRNAI